MAEPVALLPWGEIVESLHALLGAMVARSQYPLGHPAVARADDLAAGIFGRLLERLPELVVALVDGEFVVAERPMPELRDRVPALADAFDRHGIECLVFVRGLGRDELAEVASALWQPDGASDRATARDRIRAASRHVLVRFIDRREEEVGTLGAVGADYIVPEVEALLYAVGSDVASGGRVDTDSVRSVARRIVARLAAREYRLYLRSHDEGLADFAGHAANVAMMTAAMVLDAGHPEASCVDATAAALLHDTGQLLLPEGVRGRPEPLLDARGKHLYRQHPFLGARALLSGGCPPLWIAAALEHHRGMDGHGYPALQSTAPPHEAVSILSLANYVDNKRASIDGRSNTPDDAVGQALSLADRYFEPSSIALFMRALGLYPPGTTVELSCGSYAITTRANPSDPRRPQVELLFGPRAGHRFELKEFDSVERRYVRSIVRAVPPPMVAVDEAEPAPAS